MISFVDIFGGFVDFEDLMILGLWLLLWLRLLIRSVMARKRGRDWRRATAFALSAWRGS